MKTIQQIKQSLISYNCSIVKSNTTMSSKTMAEDIANQVWDEELRPYLLNETITSWEKDIQEKMINNTSCRWFISEKQAYCLARAFQAINPDTISVN